MSTVPESINYRPFIKKQSLRFILHDFDILPNNFQETQTVSCHNHSWCLEFCPKNNGHVAVYLKWKPSNNSVVVDANVSLSIRSYTLNIIGSFHSFKFDACRFGSNNFITQEKARSLLQDGALIIDVEIHIYQPKRQKIGKKIWYPSITCLNSKNKDLLSTGKWADITFVVGNKKFPVHRCILESSAPILLTLAENVPSNKPVIIENVKPKIFQHLLNFIYTNELPQSAEDWNQQLAKDLLNTANQFGCKELKLHIESFFAEFGIDIENNVDMILFADAMCCPLLKEVAVDFFVTNYSAVVLSDGWKQAKLTDTTFTFELLEYAFGPHQQLSGNSNNYCNLTVSALRKELEWKGLDVDGTREMLVKRLDSAKK